MSARCIGFVVVSIAATLSLIGAGGSSVRAQPAGNQQKQADAGTVGRQQARLQVDMQQQIRELSQRAERYLAEGDCDRFYVLYDIIARYIYRDASLIKGDYLYRSRQISISESYNRYGEAELTDHQLDEVRKYAENRRAYLDQKLKSASCGKQANSTGWAIIPGKPINLPCIPDRSTEGTTLRSRFAEEDNSAERAWNARFGKDWPGQAGNAYASVPRRSSVECFYVFASLDYSWVRGFPQVNGGTQFDRAGGSEVPIARSADVLSGTGGRLFAIFPTNNTLWGDYFFIDASGSAFDGSSSGLVPVGGNNVAYTYLFPNPTSDSTGISAGATGQEVRIDTNGHLVDVSAGLKKVIRLPGAPGSPLLQGPDLHATLGLRYRNFGLSHTIEQQSLFFPELFSRIDLDQRSNFVGPQFGAGLISQPGPRGGLFGSIHGFVAPGVLFTSATADQLSHCGPCGAASPEYNVSLQRSFDENQFSVIVGGSAQLGYQFNDTFGIFVRGSVEHMTNVPFLQVPTTPAEQPVFVEHGGITNASIIAGLRFTAPVPRPLPP